MALVAQLLGMAGKEKGDAANFQLHQNRSVSRRP